MSVENKQIEKFKIVGITETTILNEEGKVVYDAAEDGLTAFDGDRDLSYTYAKEVTRLFAAAPDLLEALQSIASENYDDDDKKRHLKSCIDRIKQVAEEAIKKATQS